MASGGAGGTIEARLDSPTGDVVGTAEVPATGGLQTAGVEVDVSEAGSEHDGPRTWCSRVDSNFSLNFIEAMGQGSRPNASPL